MDNALAGRALEHVKTAMFQQMFQQMFQRSTPLEHAGTRVLLYIVCSSVPVGTKYLLFHGVRLEHLTVTQPLKVRRFENAFLKLRSCWNTGT
jgi:hypothetical protein